MGKTSIDFSGLSARGPPLTRGVHSGVTPGLPPPTPAKRRDIFRRVGNSWAEHPAPFVRFQPGDPPGALSALMATPLQLLGEIPEHFSAPSGDFGDPPEKTSDVLKAGGRFMGISGVQIGFF